MQSLKVFINKEKKKNKTNLTANLKKKENHLNIHFLQILKNNKLIIKNNNNDFQLLIFMESA